MVSFLSEKPAQFAHAAIGVREMFDGSGGSAALGFQNDAVLLDHFEMLFFPECAIEKAPVTSLPACEVTVSQEIDERLSLINRCAETQNTQRAFRTER